MQPADNRYQAYIDILNEELVTAMDCTEPITIACAREFGSNIEDPMRES